MAGLVERAGAKAFADIFDIKKGDRIEARVRQGLDPSAERVAPLTPRSMDRNWVWAEMAGAWMRQKRDIGVLHGLTLGKIERDRGGLASLAPTNILALDAFDGDIEELKERVIANSPG